MKYFQTRRILQALTGMLIILLFVSAGLELQACTSVVVGKAATVDGSVIISRNEDMSGAWAKRFIVVPRTEYQEGDMLTAYNGFSVPQPKVGFRYTALPDWDPSEGRYEAAGINEHQVAVSATNTARANDAVKEADPFVEDGIGEPIIPTLLLPRITTAEEGVELLGTLIEEHGADTAYGLFIADPNEAWYFEVGSGHRWVAARVPDDHYLVVANLLRISTVNLDDKANYRGSTDLLEFAEQNGLYDPAAGEFDFAAAYGELGNIGSTRRVWWGQHLLTPSVEQAPDAERFPLFMKPDKQLAVSDVMAVLRGRYEGTPYCPDTETGEDERAIGIYRTMESHVIQLRDWLPNDVGGVLWLCMANPYSGIYLPFYAGITSTPEAYTLGTDQYDEESAYWIFRALGALAETDKTHIEPAIIAMWEDYAQQLYQQQAAIDEAATNLFETQGNEAGRQFVTTYSHNVALRAMEIARAVKTQVLTRIASKRDKPFEPQLP